MLFWLVRISIEIDFITHCHVVILLTSSSSSGVSLAILVKNFRIFLTDFQNLPHPSMLIYQPGVDSTYVSTEQGVDNTYVSTEQGNDSTYVSTE
jgi:hypothetical protein